MKLNRLWEITLVLCCALALFTGLSGAAETSGYVLKTETIGADDGSFVNYPVLTGADEALCEKINSEIAYRAMLSQYEGLMNGAAGSSGVKVSYRANIAPDGACAQVLSLVIVAEGRQPQGRPGIRCYPMTFDLTTGEPVSFSALCSDVDGAVSTMEEYAMDVAEPALSDYMENRELLPVPEDSFFLDGSGKIVFYYDKDALSFLSGQPGAFAMSEGDFAGALDTSADGIYARSLNEAAVFLPLSLLGQELDPVLNEYKSPLDSFYHAQGEAYLTEEALLMGTYLISRRGETVDAVLMTQLLPGELKAGVTHRDALFPAQEAQNITDEAEVLLVCEGKSVQSEDDLYRYTYYFDTDDLLYAVLAEMK